MRAIVTALFAAALLFAPMAVAEAHGCHHGASDAQLAGALDHKTPCLGDPAEACACCLGSCAIAPVLSAEDMIAIAPAEATVFTFAAEPFAASRSIPPLLGPPRS